MPSTDHVQISVKVPPRVVERAEKLRPFVSEETGRSAARSDVFRRAIAIGLKALAQKSRDARASEEPNDEPEPDLLGDDGIDESEVSDG